MWILKFLPDFIFHLIFIAGLLGLGASFVLKFVPFVTQYRPVIQVAASIMIAVGLYMEGAISDNTAWMDRVHALEKKVAEAEARSADANTQLVDTIAKNKEKIAEELETKRTEFNLEESDIQKMADTIRRELRNKNKVIIKLFKEALDEKINHCFLFDHNWMCIGSGGS